ALASAVVKLQRDEAMLRLLTHGVTSGRVAPNDGLVWLRDQGTRSTWDALPKHVQSAIIAVADAESPGEALTAVQRVRVLTAHREHRFGAAGLNQAIQHYLVSRPGLRRVPNHPLIINRNDPDTSLTNGSVGVVMT